MFSNYLKVAWRNIARNKVNSIINIAGLAIGMTCVILILFYVQDELQYDRFFQNADRIYQVNLDGNFGGQAFYVSNTPPTIGPELVSEVPEIETCTRIYHPGNLVIRSQESNQPENYFTETGVLAVDTSEAECLPGVQAVLTAWNTPDYRFGSDFEDQTLFARHKVLHRGAVLAAVAATDLATAEAAAQCIRVTYEPLPAVLDVLEALKPDAPLLHEDLATYAGVNAAHVQLR
jgi:hypothetical protein